MRLTICTRHFKIFVVIIWESDGSQYLECVDLSWKYKNLVKFPPKS
jgi:hypothetical protein